MTKDRTEHPPPSTRKHEASPAVRKDAFTGSVQLLPLPPGLFLISVTANSPSVVTAGSALALPTLQVSPGPGVSGAQLEILASGANESGWLFAPKDLLVVRVKGPGATLVLTSVRDPAGETLAVKVERLDSGATTAPTATVPTLAPVVAADASLLPLQITAHVRTRGDMRFTDAPWAGRVATGLWIESFSLRPLAQLAATDIEYKGLTGSGFETPWITDEGECGTKGLSVPLVGFAVRLKGANKATAAFDCEYSGYFKSGVTVGPLRNGAPCRSTVANDPLEGIQVRVRRRAVTRAAAAAPTKVAAKAATAATTRAKRVPTRGR